MYASFKMVSTSFGKSNLSQQTITIFIHTIEGMPTIKYCTDLLLIIVYNVNDKCKKHVDL